jgi:LacI family transcriptional regulator
MMARGSDEIMRTIWVSISGRSSYWREIMRGAVDRLRSIPGLTWAVLDELPIATIQRRPPTALVARVSSNDDVQRLLQAGVRVVNVSAARKTAFPHAIPDDEAIGRMAAGCFRGLGLRRFVYLGDGTTYSTGRRQGLLAEARRLGCHVVATPEDMHPAAVDLRGIVDGGDASPVGILACNDDTACAVLQRCISTGVRVPQEACILGVGNEDIVLIRSPLPLSSIELPAYGIGALAADMALRWSPGSSHPPKDRLLPPLRIIHRQTTAASGIADPLVRAALDMVYQRACESLAVPDVVRNIGATSRRTLEMRFRHATGRTIHGEIRAGRLARARELLGAGALSIKEVARVAGFSSPQKFCGVFRQAVGCSPREYRRRMGSHQ